MYVGRSRWGESPFFVIDARMDPYADPSAYTECCDSIFKLASPAGKREVV